MAEENLVGLVEKEAVLDHAESGLESGGEKAEVGGKEGAVEKVVALVGDDGGRAGEEAEGGGGEEVEEAAAGAGSREPDDLDRQGLGGAEVVDQLGGCLLYTSDAADE